MLQIAWSMAWGLLALLFLLMWARSYWRVDFIYHYRYSSLLVVRSQWGGVSFTNGTAPGSKDGKWGYNTDPIKSHDDMPRITGVSIPYWVFALSSTAVAALPCIRWRFSLRTLLIATAIIEVDPKTWTA